MIKVFIGYDPREAIAFSVLAHSIHNKASKPVSITPLMLSQLNNYMSRPRDNLQSTDFAFSRFLVPYLCGYEGWAIFMDCDMLVNEDINNLWDLRDEKYAVQVVKHDHKPNTSIKFLGQKQTTYEKKNWSSVMLINCAKCKNLTLDYINSASGLELHRFHWLKNENLIGEIPHKWNHLVDYDPHVNYNQLANIHFTEGGPYFNNYIDCSYANEWFAEKAKMLNVIEKVEMKTEEKV